MLIYALCIGSYIQLSSIMHYLFSLACIRLGREATCWTAARTRRS